MSGFLKRATTLKKDTSGNTKATTNKLKHFDASQSRASDVLSARANQLKHILKAFIAFYETQRDGHTTASKEILKQSQGLPVPLHESDQFLQDENGLQHSLYGLRDRSQAIYSLEAEWAALIDANILEPLNGIRKDLATHADGIDSDLGKTADEVDAEREASSQAIGEHSKGIGLIGGQESGFTASNWKADPFISENVVSRQLAKQLDAENRLTRSTVHHQDSWKQFENKLSLAMQAAHKEFRRTGALQEEKLKAEWVAIDQVLGAVAPDAEWNHFAEPDFGRILDPNTSLRDPNLITFPNQGHAASSPLKSGQLLRKKRFTKSYRECHFVLTKAGFLHAFPPAGYQGADPKQLEPDLSLYLPDMNLGPPAAPTDKKHKFYLTGGSKAAAGKDAVKSFLGKKDIAYTFKARSHADMQAWWDTLRIHVKSALTAAAATETSTQPRSAYSETVSNVGLRTDTESGFTKHPYSSSFVSSGWSTRSTEEAGPALAQEAAPSVVAHSNSDLPSAVGLPALGHKASQEFSDSGSSVEEETAHVVHDPLKEALAKGQGPSGIDERPTVDHETTPNPSHYGQTTPQLSHPEAHLEGELPQYVGSSEYSLPQEKKRVDSLPSAI